MKDPLFFPLLFFLEVMENEKCSVNVKNTIKNESFGWVNETFLPGGKWQTLISTMTGARILWAVISEELCSNSITNF